jgi:CDP-diacylglycerol--glycerol-3-phosphate 3-phosphatidyltransferase
MSAVTNEVNATESALSSLRKSWFFLLILQGLLIWVGTQLLSSWWTPQYAVRWFGLAIFSSLIFFGILWRSLNFNSRPGNNDLLGEFGLGNLLTILRGVILALLFGFLFSPWPQGWLAWVPGLLYTFAAIADLFDGYLARRFNHETLLGEKLDLSLDGWGMLIASMLLVQYGQVPAWYLLVGLARYLFVAGIWLRRKMGKPVFDLTINSTRRPFAGAQMGFVAVVLYPLFSPPGTTLAAALFAVPFLVGFTIDWLEVNGMKPSHFLLYESRLSSMAGRIQADRRSRWKIKKILTKWFPLGLRISLVILLGIWVERNLFGLFSQQYFTAANLIADSAPPFLWLGLLLLFIVIGIFMIAIGAAGRIAALVVLFGVGIYLNYFGLNLTEALLVVGAAAILYSGTGPYSVWMPERGIISRRLGEM